jgi:hypothetical protein
MVTLQVSYVCTTLGTLKMSRFYFYVDTVEQELIKLSAKSNMHAK